MPYAKHNNAFSPPVPKNAFGREAALANLSPRQAREKGLLMSGTYGHHGSTLYNNAALNLSLASKLHTAAVLISTPLYSRTWLENSTRLGTAYWTLAVLARPIKEREGSLWVTIPGPTPTSHGASLRQAGGRGGRNMVERDPKLCKLYGPPNPDLFRWLMGLPKTYIKYAPSETQLSRLWPSNLSVQH